MRIYSLIEHSDVNGPGTRAVVWFQGCKLACQGCHNPETHPFEGGSVTTPARIAERILGINSISGVSFSGGEPMHQAPEFLELMQILRERNKALNFGMFTGYSEKELSLGNYDCEGATQIKRRLLWGEIKNCLSFAVMGRYVLNKPSKDPMLSSTNQQLVLFGTTFRPEDFPAQSFEVLIHNDGFVQVTGFPTKDMTCELRKSFKTLNLI